MESDVLPNDLLNAARNQHQPHQFQSLEMKKTTSYLEDVKLTLVSTLVTETKYAFQENMNCLT